MNILKIVSNLYDSKKATSFCYHCHMTPATDKNTNSHQPIRRIWFLFLNIGIVIVAVIILNQIYRTHTLIVNIENLIVQTNISTIKVLSQDISPHENTLSIPRLDVSVSIAEGEHEKQKDFNKTWRRQHTSKPSDGGNTVIVGHRYRNNASGHPLYQIEKLKIDDKIYIDWSGEQYVYKIYNTTVVDDTAIEIEDPTDESLLTLYACDWSGGKRLVVQASLIE